MITNPTGYGSCSLNNPKPAKVKVEDTRGQALLVQVPTQGLSVQAELTRHGKRVQLCGRCRQAQGARAGDAHTSQAEFQVRLKPAKSLCDGQESRQAPWASLSPVNGAAGPSHSVVAGWRRVAQVKVPAVPGPRH